MNNKVTPENIISLENDEIFVFGSNESGYHGGGAAHLAFKKFGAKWGLGFGPSRDTFAIPTKSWFIKDVLKLDVIKIYIERFIDFAKENPEYKFLVTQIGCGLAGYKPDEIAPLFKSAVNMDNIYLPQCFWDVLNKEK